MSTPVMLVTLSEAKLRLKIDDDDQDADLQLIISGASEAVLRYLNMDDDAYDDSDGEIPVDSDDSTVGIPAQIKNAVLLLTGILFKDRSGTDSAKWQAGYLPAPVVSLLYSLRDPSVA